jgi:hypothetical protein
MRQRIQARLDLFEERREERLAARRINTLIFVYTTKTYNDYIDGEANSGNTWEKRLSRIEHCIDCFNLGLERAFYSITNNSIASGNIPSHNCRNGNDFETLCADRRRSNIYNAYWNNYWSNLDRTKNIAGVVSIFILTITRDSWVVVFTWWMENFPNFDFNFPDHAWILKRVKFFIIYYFIFYFYSHILSRKDKNYCIIIFT